MADLVQYDPAPAPTKAEFDALNSKLNSNANETKDILADAVSVNGTKFFNGSGSSYTGGVPTDNYKYGIFTVMQRGNLKFVVAHSPTNEIAINYYNGSSWSGWQQIASNKIVSSIGIVNASTNLASVANENAENGVKIVQFVVAGTRAGDMPQTVREYGSGIINLAGYYQSVIYCADTGVYCARKTRDATAWTWVFMEGTIIS